MSGLVAVVTLTRRPAIWTTPISGTARIDPPPPTRARLNPLPFPNPLKANRTSWSSAWKGRAVARLHVAIRDNDARLAVARTGDQAHPVFCLCKTNVLASLTRFLESGGRKIDAWYSALEVVEVRFDDQPQAFSNINTEAELRSASREPRDTPL